MPRTRKSGEGGFYHDDKRDLWIGVVDNGFNENGGRAQKRVSSRSQSKARVKFRALQAEIEATGSPMGNRTVASWSEYWLANICEPKLKPQPLRTYRSYTKNWVLPTIGRKNLKDVRPSDLRTIYDKMKAKGLSSSSQLKAHNVMSSMFEAARFERLVKANVTKDIHPPKAGKTTRGTLSPDQTLRILQAAAGRQDGSKWLVSLYAGIRQGERLGATLDSVDLERGLFTVRWNMVEANYKHGHEGECSAKSAGRCPTKQLVIPDGVEYRVLKGRFVLLPPKSGESRTFPLPQSLLTALEQHMAELSLRPNPYGLLWPDSDGSPIDSRHDQQQWKTLLADAQVASEGVTTHWARHTAISDFTAAGVPDRTIGEVVGHKSPGVTGNYQHVSSKDAADAMQKLSDRRR
jgi:site-specific recombinase XerD